MFLVQKICLLVGLGMMSASFLACHASKVSQKDQTNVPVMMPKWITDKQRECQADGDCILVPAGCCGCGQGGQQTAIHKQSIGDVATARAYACSETLCVQMLSKDASCQAKSAQCAAGVCVPTLNK